MHLISMKAILDAVIQFPQHREELLFLGRTIEKSHCTTPVALRKIFPTLDNLKYLDKHYVIDIANNNLRVVALIFFESQSFMCAMFLLIRNMTVLRRNIALRGRNDDRS